MAFIEICGSRTHISPCHSPKLSTTIFLFLFFCMSDDEFECERFETRWWWRRRRIWNGQSMIKTCKLCKLCRLCRPCNIGTNHFLNEKKKNKKEDKQKRVSCDLWMFTFWMTNFSFSTRFVVHMGNLWYGFRYVLISAILAIQLNNRNAKILNRTVYPFAFIPCLSVAFFFFYFAFKCNSFIRHIHFVHLRNFLSFDMQKSHSVGFQPASEANWRSMKKKCSSLTCTIMQWRNNIRFADTRNAKRKYDNEKWRLKWIFKSIDWYWIRLNVNF